MEASFLGRMEPYVLVKATVSASVRTSIPARAQGAGGPHGSRGDRRERRAFRSGNPGCTTARSGRRDPAAWVNQAEIDAGQRPGVSTDEGRRIAELERENRELRRANEILKAASAFFARELDPRPPSATASGSSRSARRWGSPHPLITTPSRDRARSAGAATPSSGPISCGYTRTISGSTGPRSSGASRTGKGSGLAATGWPG
jgi:hypothetical protein